MENNLEKAKINAEKDAKIMKDIFDVWLENKQARLDAGFSMAGDRAIEDTAIMFDTSIEKVCMAISMNRGK